MTLTSMPNHLSGVVSAEIGTPVEMKCTAYSRPESQYRWFHNGSLLSFSGENISLPSLTWDQMGSYRCVVGNSVTQLTFYQRLQVQVPCECGTCPLGLRPPDLPQPLPLLGWCLAADRPTPPCEAMLTRAG